MKKEFIVERQGRSFVLYAGLLDMAHQQGLRSIRTELVQAPGDGNGKVAICSATVVLEMDGQERAFTGIGDAAPANVAPAMQNCLIRMAETRAKARAMRDAVNVGVAAFEEIDEFEGASTPGPAAAHQAPVRRSEAGAPLATDAQRSAIRRLCERVGVDPEFVCAKRSRSLATLAGVEAAQVIEELNEMVRAAA